LNNGLAYAREARNFKKIQDMVDMALVLKNRRGIMEHKQKMQHTGALESKKKFCDGSSFQGPVFCSGQPQRMQVAAQEF
jgi:hypothetical protein